MTAALGALPQCISDQLLSFLDYASFCSLFQISKSWADIQNSTRVWSSALCRSDHSETLVQAGVLLVQSLWRSRRAELTKTLKEGHNYSSYGSDGMKHVHEEYVVPVLRLLSWRGTGNLYKDSVSRFWPLTMRIWFQTSEGATTTQEIKAPGPIDVYLSITNHSSLPRTVACGRGFERDRPLHMSLTGGRALQFLSERDVSLLTPTSLFPKALPGHYVGNFYRCGTGMADFEESILPHSTRNWVTPMAYFATAAKRTDIPHLGRAEKNKRHGGPRLRTNCWEVAVDGVSSVVMMACVYSRESSWTLGEVGRELLCCSNLIKVGLPKNKKFRFVVDESEP